MKLRIHVTKEIYRRSMMCGTGITVSGAEVRKSCAIALAVRDMAPFAEVFKDYIQWLGEDYGVGKLPLLAMEMILRFDLLKDRPTERLNLPEFSFDVDFPDELVDRIGLSELKSILEKSETLEEV